ncbi:WD40 repeat protein [Ichthyophthirius multifiliis]|uniref:WD40 repeat protein n=1 Tax=Ichthyophthirius multifiliis TaxID=5932 RepID=G0QY00_ICHMU|nr:WD40 repeat protein [Ichthyophthirius multifiliis]EGR29900.1 WD40 repeat protein [Ichthyophthirius multifiliis]|eukprot:XP_004031136.1 WD40 repeat protein [Ichthyophthirius multifiliis]
MKLIGKNEEILMTSSKDKSLLKWDLQNQKRIGAYVQKMGGINSFDVLNNDFCIIVGQDKKINFTNGNKLIKSVDTSSFKSYQDECMSLCVSKSGTFFVTGGTEKSVKVWNIVNGSLLFEGKGGHSSTINIVQISDNDKQIISGGKDGNILIWDLYM